MKIFVVLILALNCSLGFSLDLTQQFESFYASETVLDGQDLERLKESDLILIPGIASETFDSTDNRSVLDFSLFFKNYLAAQESRFSLLGLRVTKLRSSSFSITESQLEIHKKINDLRGKGRKAIFMTHSLGGMILLDYLLRINPEAVTHVRGIIFMQSPFHGSPIASVYLQNSYHVRTLLGPVMRFLNTSEETVDYLSMATRKKWMTLYAPLIEKLTSSVPMLTLGGVSQHHPSLMQPSINIMAHGCLTLWNERCLTEIVYSGPYEDSDGMVPFSSSRLKNVDYVKLTGVDHGETVLSLPFKSIDRAHMSETLMKLLLTKM